MPPAGSGTVEEGVAIGGGLNVQIHEAMRQVQLRLRRHTDRSGLVRREVEGLDRLGAAGDALRRAELAEALNVSRRTAQNEFATLDGLGLVARVGRARAIRWTRAR